MIGTLLFRAGVRGWHLHAVSLGWISVSLSMWVRAKTIDQDERGNAERRAIFVGTWPAMFWLIGDAVERAATARPRRLAAGRRG